VIGLASQSDGGLTTFQQFGGTVSASDLNFGYYYRTGQYNMSAGSLTVGSINFGPAGDSGGAITQTGGTGAVQVGNFDPGSAYATVASISWLRQSSSITVCLQLLPIPESQTR
jgi:hypothetical protein